MSSGSGSDRRNPDHRGRSLRFGLIVALLAAWPVAAWWAVEQGGDAGRVALWLGAVPQIFAYLALLWLFGRSLRPPGEPLITRLARLVHGELPPEIERYTRAVTIFWCLFFAAMSLASIALLALVSIEAWLFFANVLNLPLLACAFVGEYLVRLIRFPRFSHLSLSGTVQAYRRFRQSLHGE